MDTIRFGDPLDMATDVGTLIDEQAAVRVEGMLQRAVDAGARPLRGWKRNGAQRSATILTSVTPEMDVVCDEIFGPAMTIQPYEHIEPIFKLISDSPVRPAVRGLHQLARPGPDDLPQSAHRRCDRQRHLALAFRPDALRRRQGQWHRPRGTEILDS